MRRFFLCVGILAAFIFGGPAFAGTEGTNGSERASRRATTSAGKVPTFTLDQAILTALQRNPTLLNAEQEIKRTKGVIIQVRAQALPQVNVNATYEWTDPNLVGARILGGTSTTTTGGTGTGAAASLVDSPASQVRDAQTFAAAAPTATPGVRNTQLSDVSYSISVLGTQLIFNGTTFNQIRGTFFQRDSAYFAF